MTHASQPWVRWAQRAAALAQNGLTYCQNPFDRERYETLRRIAAEMLAHIADAPPEKVEALLEGQVGYTTPKVDVRGAVFQASTVVLPESAEHRIHDPARRDTTVLLVREAIDGRWSLPGGWADPGDTPREAIEREILEESGYVARAVKLAAVLDREHQGHVPPLPFAAYKLFFLCQIEGGQPTTSKETTEVGFFPVNDLPPLSEGRVTPAQIHRLLEHHLRPEQPTDFD